MIMNEYCYQISPTKDVWVYASNEEEAEGLVFEQLGYDPEEMNLIEVLENV
jgi:hypothetical protein